MRLACATCVYHEERFLPKFVQLMKNRVDRILVLNSTMPWFGDNEADDKSAIIARDLGCDVIEHNWPNEHEQRNTGQFYLSNYDWIIWLDPDEYITSDMWNRLVAFLSIAQLPAYVPQLQHTYWKHGYVISPPEDYKQIIAVRPQVRFVDKRVINSAWGLAPIDLHHFSWARTNDECLRKITHYAHAKDFNTMEWFNNIWLTNKRSNLHPLTPESLKRAVKVSLPVELEALGLWP